MQARNAAKPIQIVKVRVSRYQPNRAELREDVKIDIAPEKLAKSVMRQVQVAEGKAS